MWKFQWSDIRSCSSNNNDDDGKNNNTNDNYDKNDNPSTDITNNGTNGTSDLTVPTNEIEIDDCIYLIDNENKTAFLKHMMNNNIDYYSKLYKCWWKFL